MLQVGKEFQSGTLVVDFDVWLSMCLAVWAKQVETDSSGIRKLYDSYDDDGNGVLSFEVHMRQRAEPRRGCLLACVPHACLEPAESLLCAPAFRRSSATSCALLRRRWRRR